MFDPFFIPTRRPTGTEYAVIAVLFSTVFIIGGLVALVVAWRAPIEQHEASLRLARDGVGSIVLGVLIAGVFWLIRRFRNSI
jgi:hypothetical protein